MAVVEILADPLAVYRLGAHSEAYDMTAHQALEQLRQTPLPLFRHEQLAPVVRKDFLRSHILRQVSNSLNKKLLVRLSYAMPGLGRTPSLLVVETFLGVMEEEEELIATDDISFTDELIKTVSASRTRASTLTRAQESLKNGWSLVMLAGEKNTTKFYPDRDFEHYLPY